MQTLKIYLAKIVRTKKSIYILLAIIIVAGGVYYKYYYNQAVTTYEYVKVNRQDLQKTVEGSGSVVSQSELSIQQLQSGGKVTSVNVKPGDYVKQGQIIARLDSRAQAIQVSQARANYDKVVNGSTDIEMQILRQNLANAQNSYDLAVKTQDLNILNAKRTLLNSGVAALPQYDSRIIAASPTVTGSYVCNDEIEYRVVMQSNDIASVSDSKGNSFSVNLSSVPQVLGSCGLYLSFDFTKNYNNGDWKITLPNKTSTSYSSNLNLYNNALQAKDSALLSASTSVVTANLSLQQKIVGARSEDILVSKSQLDSANLNYENTIIRAPFDGQIGNVSAIVGQQTNSQQGIATIITTGKLAKIALNEVDVTNVKIGQEVKVSFDAIPGETFKGTVYQMDTVGVATSNVVSFGVKISIDSKDERIRSGMSVTANIIASEKKNVLTIANGTIKEEKVDGVMKRYVMKSMATSNEILATSSKKSSGKSRGAASVDAGLKTYIVVGINNDVDTEILEGLLEGDRVVSKTVNAGAAAKKPAASFSLFGGGGAGGGRR